jgi:gliding motility-associated-like protein/uncharacterized repeat protein (TIGR01451 family)
VNDPPIANFNTGTTPESTPLSINVVSNDTDIDGQIDPTTVTISTQPLHGTVSVNPVTGLLTYTPNALFNGKDSLVYRVCDNGTPLPAQCDTAIVYLTVTGVNHPPVANVDGATTNEDVPVTVRILTNDTDIDSNLDPKTVKVTQNPVNGKVKIDPITGALTYTPNAGFFGRDSLIYRVCDSGNPSLCDTAKVFFNVLHVNHPPVVTDIDEVITVKDSTRTVCTRITDKDANDVFSAMTICNPTKGTVSTPTVSGNELCVAYSANRGTTGVDSVCIKVCDAAGACDTVVFRFKIPKPADTIQAVSIQKRLAVGQPIDNRYGSVVNYTIYVTNNGNYPMTNVDVRDSIPVGMAFNTANPLGWTYNAAQKVATTRIPSIGVGKTIPVNISMILQYGNPGTTVRNRAQVFCAIGVTNINIIDSLKMPNDTAIIKVKPYDPIGNIYSERTGQLIMGGRIELASAPAGGAIYFAVAANGDTLDGRNGTYQFYTNGVEGVYNIKYVNPNGYPLSTTHLPVATPISPTNNDGDITDANRDGVIDRDGIVDGLVTLSSATVLDSHLTNYSAVANPYYLSFNLKAGDPFINQNNIPVQTSTLLGAHVAIDANENGLFDVGEIPIGNVPVYLYNDAYPNIVVATTTTTNAGTYIFENLEAGTYHVSFGVPNGYKFTKAHNPLNQLLNSDADTLTGITQSITLGWGKIDSSLSALYIAKKAPIVTGNPLTTLKNAPITLCVPIQSGLNDQLTSTICGVKHGLVTQNIVGQNLCFTYTPVSGYVGLDTLCLSVCNRDGLCDTASFAINVYEIITRCGSPLNPEFATRGSCSGVETQFTATAGFTNYNWNFGDGATATGATTTHEYNAPMGGNYTATLVVTSAIGCTDSIKKQVVIYPMVWANAGVDKTICQGDSVQLGAQGGTHYSWLPAGTLNNAEIFNPIATPSVSTTYYVFISNDYGCSAVDSVTVFVNPKPRIVSRTGSLSTCSNGSMPVRIQLSEAISSYQIAGSAGYSNAVVSGSTLTFNATLNGNINNMSVILRGVNGCAVTDTFSLFLAANPTADFVVIEPFCNNAETTLLFTGRATPASILTYNLGDGVIVRRSAATATRPLGDTTVVRFPNFGSKLLKLTVNDGGCLSDKSTSIFVRKSPKTVVVTNDTTVCAGNCVPLYGTAGILDCVYKWTPSTGLSSTNTANTTACPTITTTYTLTVIDINGCSSSDSVKVTVENVTSALVGVPADITVECNNVPTMPTVTETSGATVRPTEVKTAGNCPNSYTLTRTWTATNRCGQVLSKTQTVTVQDRTAPVLTNIPLNITMNCGGNVPNAAILTATDNCDNAPTVTSVDVKTNGICGNNYTITRTWTARDACNNTSTASQTITVQDAEKPTLANVPANTTLSCDATLPLIANVTAVDGCDANPRITFAEVKTNGLCPSSYTLTRTWTATDVCGNAASASQTIIVLDLTKPVLAGVPANVTVECNGTLPTPPTVTATDNCDPSVTRAILAEKRTNTTCGYTLTRTWTATDACGNAQTGSQVITVEDRTAPTFGNTPTTVSVDCIEKLNTVATPSVSDACDANPTVIFVQSVTDSTCTNKKKITRIYTAKDNCGNTKTLTQTITVNDNIAPVITPRNPLLAGLRSGDTLTMSCEDIRLFQLGDATAVDNCNGCTPTIRFEDIAVRRGICSTDGFSLLMECRWIAADCCGNTSEWRIFIKVTDNKAPVLANIPTNITVNSASQVPTIPVVTAADNCTDTVSVTFRETSVAAGQDCDYIITRTWTASDACGNITQRNQQILVRATLDIKAIKTDDTCSRNGATITMIPSTGVTYKWADGTRGAFRTGLSAGVYAVTATAGLCEKTLSVAILNNTEGCCTTPIATVAKTDATCGSNNGTATIAVDNAANYTFKWSFNGAQLTANGAQLTALTAGTYSITVSRTNAPSCSTVVATTIANNTANCCGSFIAQTSVLRVLQDCGAKADVCVEIAPNAIANYTITDNGAPYTGSFGTCQTGSTMSFAAGEHQLVFIKNGSNCRDSLFVKVVCIREMTIQRTVQLPETKEYCFTAAALGLTGTITSMVNECPTRADNSQITINNVTHCVSYKALSIGIDTACLKITTSTGDVANMSFVVTVTTATCGRFIAQDSVMITNACTDSTKVCINIPYNDIIDYAITLNGTAYNGGLESCKNGTATNVLVLRGRSKLIFTNRLTGCTDSLTVNAACIVAQRIENTMLKGKTDTLCIDTRQLIGTRYRISTMTSSTNQYVRFGNLAGTTCVNRAALNVGTEQVAYVVSDEYGMSDTIYITTHVIELASSIRRPIAANDKFETLKGKAILIDAMTNDSLFVNNGTLTIVSEPLHGKAIVTADFRILYTPDTDYCNAAKPDVLRYVICNRTGCDTATVNITVVCDGLKVYTGFSPNNDGMNDYFVIEGAENFPKNTLIIYNRWGNAVLDTKGYKNDWGGNWNGQSVPDGTYFYIFSDGEGKQKTGYIQIQR